MANETDLSDAAPADEWIGDAGAEEWVERRSGEVTNVPPVHVVLSRIIGDLPAVPKDQEQSGTGGYKYRSVHQVVTKLNPIMAKHGLVVLPSLLSIEQGDRQVNNRPWLHTRAQVAFSFIGPRGDTLQFVGIDGQMHGYIVVPGESLDNSDKGTAKAWTNCWKNMLLWVFMVAVQDEANNDTDTNSPQIDGPQGANSGTLAQAYLDGIYNVAKSQRNMDAPAVNQYVFGVLGRNPGNLTIDEAKQVIATFGNKSIDLAPPRPATPTKQHVEVTGDGGEVIGVRTVAAAPQQPPAATTAPPAATNAGHPDVSMDEKKAEVINALVAKGVTEQPQQIEFCRLFFVPVRFKDTTVGDWQRLKNFIGWAQPAQMAAFWNHPQEVVEEWQRPPANAESNPTDDMFDGPVQGDLTDFDAVFPPGETHAPVARSATPTQVHPPVQRRTVPTPTGKRPVAAH